MNSEKKVTSSRFSFSLQPKPLQPDFIIARPRMATITCRSRMPEAFHFSLFTIFLNPELRTRNLELPSSDFRLPTSLHLTLISYVLINIQVICYDLYLQETHICKSTRILPSGFHFCFFVVKLFKELGEIFLFTFGDSYPS